MIIYEIKTRCATIGEVMRLLIIYRLLDDGKNYGFSCTFTSVIIILGKSVSCRYSCKIVNYIVLHWTYILINLVFSQIYNKCWLFLFKQIKILYHHYPTSHLRTRNRWRLEIKLMRQFQESSRRKLSSSYKKVCVAARDLLQVSFRFIVSHGLTLQYFRNVNFCKDFFHIAIHIRQYKVH